MKADLIALQNLSAAGVDLYQVHTIRFALWFRDETLAKNAYCDLHELGMNAYVRRSPDQLGWACFAERQMVPTARELLAIREKLDVIAKKTGGQYKGWSLSPAASRNFFARLIPGKKKSSPYVS